MFNSIKQMLVKMKPPEMNRRYQPVNERQYVLNKNDFLTFLIPFTILYYHTNVPTAPLSSDVVTVLPLNCILKL